MKKKYSSYDNEQQIEEVVNDDKPSQKKQYRGAFRCFLQMSNKCNMLFIIIVSLMLLLLLINSYDFFFN